MATKKRTYLAEFMQEAIRQWESSGKGAVQIERELGIAQSWLNKWKRQLKILAGSISCATILGSRLPEQSADQLDLLRRKFPTEEMYFNWFICLKADVLDLIRLTFYAGALNILPEGEPPTSQVQKHGFAFD